MFLEPTSPDCELRSTSQSQAEALLQVPRTPPAACGATWFCSDASDSSAQDSLPEPHCDIGSLITPEKSINEVCRSVGKLSNAEKHSYLYHHVEPPNALPSTYAHGCN